MEISEDATSGGASMYAVAVCVCVRACVCACVRALGCDCVWCGKMGPGHTYKETREHV